MEGAIRSVFIKGNIKETGQIITKIPHNDLKYGLWQIGIKTVSYTCKEPTNIVVNICCNYVTDITFTLENTVVPYENALCLFHLKGNKDEIRVSQMDIVWFLINSYDDNLILILKDTNFECIKKNIDVNALILIRRIK